MTYFIDEIYGLGDVFDDPNNPVNNTLDPFTPSGSHFPKLDYGKSPDLNTSPLGERMSIWQRWFVDKIFQKQDTLMTVPPGAGKTTPILYAWNRQFRLALGIDDDPIKASWDNFQIPNRIIEKRSREFPRMLYIGRTKQLSDEAFAQNIRGDDKFGLIKTILENPSKFDPRLTSPGRVITKDFEDQVLRLINDDLLGIKTGSINTSIESSRFGVKCVYISTPSIGKLPDIVKMYGKYFNTIVIDESQNYMIKPYEQRQNKSDDDMFEMYLDVIRFAPPPGECGVHLLTGTTNYSTGKQLMEDLNKCYKRSFSAPPMVQNINDPNDKGTMFFSRNFKDTSDQRYAGNRSNINVVPYDLMNTPDQKKRLIKDIVMGRQWGSVMIIFGVGTNTKSGIFRLLDDILPELPKRSEDVLYSDNEKRPLQKGEAFDPNIHMQNKGDPLNPKQNDMIKQYGGEFVPKDSYNPLMYDYRRKNDKNRTPEKVQNDNGKPINLKDLDDIQFLKYFDVARSETGSGDEMYSNIPNPNNLVFQAALAGIGVMIGKSDSRHKIIMQKLFRARKLTLLLATDKNCRIR